MVTFLDGRLIPNPPVVGQPVIPFLRFRLLNTCITSSDIVESEPKDGVFLKYKWYRKGTGNHVCSVHTSALAKLQCVLCVKAKAPELGSFFCSTQCLADAWPQHKIRHGEPAGAEEASSSSTSSSAMVGETWYQVASTRVYEPTVADVGHMLKFEYCLFDAITKVQKEEPKFMLTSEVSQP
ncbi:Carbon catabolite repressor protein 4 homolog 1 [Linum perenne]